MKENNNDKSIDLIKLQKHLKLEKNIKLLVSKYGLYSTINFIENYFITYFGIEIISNPSTFINSASFIISIITLKGIINKANIFDPENIANLLKENNKEVTNIIKDKLINSDLYKECSKEYNDYLNSLTHLFKELKTTDVLESSILFQGLLHSGYLSHNKKYNYKIYRENAKYEISNILGSRVATGEAVCRHNSCMLTDLENKLKNNAFNLPLCFTKKEELTFIDNNLYHNHLVTGIEEKGEITIVDPTNRSIVLPDNEDKYISKFKLYHNDYIFGKYMDLSISKKHCDDSLIYIILDQDDNTFNYNNNKIDLSSKAYTIKQINDNEINKKYSKVNQIINDNEEILKIFDYDSQEQLKRINQLTQQLVPVSNKKIKKWTIK